MPVDLAAFLMGPQMQNVPHLTASVLPPSDSYLYSKSHQLEFMYEKLRYLGSAYFCTQIVLLKHRVIPNFLVVFFPF